MTTPIDAAMNALIWNPIPGAKQAGILPVATHEAVMHIGGHSIRCYVLSDGQRVLNADDVEAFFGLDVVEEPDA